MGIFNPYDRFLKISEISTEYLDKEGVCALILDVDNTLTEHNSHNISEEVALWIDEMRQENIKLIIVSNNSEERVKPFSEKINIPFIAKGKKPLAKGINQAIKTLGVPKEKVMLIGDQVFTDLLGGNFAKVRTILLEPISPEEEGFLKFKRVLENKLKLR